MYSYFIFNKTNSGEKYLNKKEQIFKQVKIEVIFKERSLTNKNAIIRTGSGYSKCLHPSRPKLLNLSFSRYREANKYRIATSKQNLSYIQSTLPTTDLCSSRTPQQWNNAHHQKLIMSVTTFIVIGYLRYNDQAILIILPQLLQSRSSLWHQRGTYEMKKLSPGDKPEDFIRDQCWKNNSEKTCNNQLQIDAWYETIDTQLEESILLFLQITNNMKIIKQIKCQMN